MKTTTLTHGSGELFCVSVYARSTSHPVFLLSAMWPYSGHIAAVCVSVSVCVSDSRKTGGRVVLDIV